MPGGSETTTTQAPKEVSEYFNKFVMPGAEEVAAMDYEAYTGDRVAGLSAMETAALSDIGALPGQAADSMSTGLSTLGDAQTGYGDVARIAGQTPAEFTSGMSALSGAEGRFGSAAAAAGLTPAEYSRGMTALRGAERGFSDIERRAGVTSAAEQRGQAALRRAERGYDVLSDVAAMTPEDYRRMTEANLSDYTTGVIDPALARMQRASEEEQMRQQAEFAKAGGFGNERRGIYEAELAARQGESRDQLIADLTRQGYSEAQAATMAQVGQRVGAGQAAASGRADIGAQTADLGLRGRQAELAARQAAASGRADIGSQQAALGLQDRDALVRAQMQAASGLSSLGAQRAGLGLQSQQAELAARQAAAAGLAGIGAQQAGLGLQGQAAELQALQAQLAGGALQRGVDQAGLEAAYSEFMREQQFPLQQFGALTGGAAAYPTGGTTTTSSTPGFGDIFSAIFSDRRLKKNITLLNTVNGVNYYRWQWNDEAKRIGASSTPPVGVIAQELQETHPHLVVTGTDGYLMVNYGGLAD